MTAEFARELERRRFDPRYQFRRNVTHGLKDYMASTYRKKRDNLVPELVKVPAKRKKVAAVKCDAAKGKGFKEPVRKWDARCSTCSGRGKIRDIRGAMVACTRCTE